MTTTLTVREAWHELSNYMVDSGHRIAEQITAAEQIADAEVTQEYGEWALGRGRSERAWIAAAVVALVAQDSTA